MASSTKVGPQFMTVPMCFYSILLTMCIIWGVSGSLHPKHLQALTSGDWPFKEVSWRLGQLAPEGQAVH